MAVSIASPQSGNVSFAKPAGGSVSIAPPQQGSVSILPPQQGSVSIAGGNVLGSMTNGATQAQGPAVSQAYADPYAAYGGTTAYHNLVNGFGNQKNSIYSSAQDATSNAGIGINNSILDLVDSLRSGQSSLDNRAVNNELAKQRGTADILSAVNRGIQSGGVTLANKNASDSSAAQAIAQAYGSIGQRQLSDVGNQYELENQDIGLAQQDLMSQAASGQRKIQTSKEQAVNNIVADAQNSLSALDAAMANASLPDRIAIDQEKQSIRNQALQQLSQYDQQLSQGVQGVQAMGQDARIAEATRRGALGQAPAQSFNYSTDAPAQFQGTGPFSSDLPIFTYKRDQM